MQMIRSFNSVGQGAFYTECFENHINVVYDCGTDSDQNHLIREINGVFCKDRNRSSIEIHTFQDALKQYVRRKDKNLWTLMQYAKVFHVEKILRQYLEVLL